MISAKTITNKLKDERYVIRRWIGSILAISMLITYLPLPVTQAATGLRLYNYATKKESIYYGKQIKVTYNGSKISNDSVPGILLNNVAYVPGYDIYAKSGIKAAYTYDSAKGTVTIKKSKVTIVLTLNSTKAKVNGVTVTMPAAPMKIKYVKANLTKILVPAKFVTEKLGYSYSLSSDSSSITIKDKITQDTSPYGNTLGNINNEGRIAGRNGWLYYYFSEYITKTKFDGTQKKEFLNIGGAQSINVNNYYMYYKRSSDGKIHRANLDGTGDIILNKADEVRSLILYDKYIYYINYSDSDSIYRMNLDGTGRKKMSGDSACINLNITKSYIIYNLNNQYLIRLNLDGTNRKIIAKKAREVLVESDYVYFINNNDQRNVYKVKLDGTGLTAVNHDQTGSFNISGDTIYYSNGDDRGKLYAIRTDGKARTKLADEGAGTINIAGGYVYYLTSPFGGEFHKIKTVALTEISNPDNAKGNLAGNIINGAFTAYNGDKIFQDDFELANMDEDGTNKTTFSHYTYNSIFSGVHGLNAVGDYVYYTLTYEHSDELFGIYRIKADGTQAPMELSASKAYFMTVAGNWIYFTKEDLSSKYTGSGPIFKIRIDGTGETIINPLKGGSGRALNVVGDDIYYINDSDGSSVYRMKTDGSGIERISSDGNVKSLIVDNNVIYYCLENSVKKIPVNVGDSTELLTEGITNLIVYQDKLYYMIYDTIYSCNTDGSEVTEIVKCTPGSSMNITAGYLYYNLSYGCLSVNRLKLSM